MPLEQLSLMAQIGSIRLRSDQIDLVQLGSARLSVWRWPIGRQPLQPHAGCSLRACVRLQGLMLQGQRLELERLTLGRPVGRSVVICQKPKVYYHQGRLALNPNAASSKAAPSAQSDVRLATA